jgi:hypothetical protein
MVTCVIRRITIESNGRASAVTPFACAKAAPVTLRALAFQPKPFVLVRRLLERYTDGKKDLKLKLMKLIFVFMVALQLQCFAYEDSDFSIVKFDTSHPLKCMYDVRLKKETEVGTLKSIAMDVRGNCDTNKSAIIRFYLQDQTINGNSWAYASFNPELKVEITGLGTEATKSSSAKATSTNNDGKNVGKKDPTSAKTGAGHRKFDKALENVISEGWNDVNIETDKKGAMWIITTQNKITLDMYDIIMTTLCYEISLSPDKYGYVNKILVLNRFKAQGQVYEDPKDCPDIAKTPVTETKTKLLGKTHIYFGEKTEPNIDNGR